jgi:hypothetical protein
MKASINKSRDHAYVLKIEHIKSIWNLLSERIGQVEIIIKCVDEVQREFDTWKSFSSFENSPQKAIKHLIIQSKSKDYQKRVKLEFSNSDWRVIELNIDASDQVLSRLYDDISDILEGIKPWYARLSKIDFINVIGIVFFILFFLLYVYMRSLPEVTDKSSKTFQEILILNIFGMGIVIFPWMFAVILNKIRKRYFPLAYFAIGQGLQRFLLDENIRWGVIVAFFISLSASFVLGLMG